MTYVDQVVFVEHAPLHAVALPMLIAYEAADHRLF